MSAIKIKKIGNSQGLTLPKDILEKGEFVLGDTLEVQFYNGRLILFKKLPHHSQMSFDGDTKLSREDNEWLEADFDEGLD